MRYLLVLALLCLPAFAQMLPMAGVGNQVAASGPSNPPTFVQVISKADSAAGTSLAVAQGSNPTSGHLIVVFARGVQPGMACTSSTVADTLNGSYTAAPGSKVTNGVTDCIVAETFYKYNITGGSANTITVTYPTGTISKTVVVVEYALAKTAADPFGSAATQYQLNPGTGTNVLSSGTVTISETSEILIGCVIDGGSLASISVSSGFTSRLNIHTPDYVTQRVMEDKVPAVGSTAATFTLNDNGTSYYTTFGVAFKAAS